MKIHNFEISFSLIINHQVKSISIEYDKDYGIDKRTGWSLCINGNVVNQFESSLIKCLIKGIKTYRDWKK
jgi:hypothetical protein